MRLIALILLFFSLQQLLADPAHDSINVIKLSDITYHSEFEKSAFYLLSSNSPTDFLKIALATNPKIHADEFLEINGSFSQAIQRIKSDKNFGKSPKKQVKFVFENLQDEFLKLYERNPMFSDVFTNGDFNCISASVMYAIAFERLNIPYEIKLLPNHAYLIAYPGSINQIVETTNPLQGSNDSYSSREKYRSVQELVDYKLISQEEVDEKGVDVVFSDNYLGEETVSLKQTIGALYNNVGLAEMEKYQYSTAYNLLKKASYLYPKKTTTAALLLCLGASLEQRNYDDFAFIVMLTELERFVFMGIPESAISDEFSQYLSSKFEADQINEADTAFAYMMHHLESQEIKNEISFNYHSDKAISAFGEINTEEAIYHIQHALAIKPDDSRAINMHVEMIFFQIKNAKSLDVSYERILEYSAEYSYLNENESFIVIHQGIMFDIIRMAYIENEFEKAEELRKQFEIKFPPGKISSIQIKNYMEQVYSMAAIIYFGQNKKSEARSLLQSGLKYIPDSYELKSKMDALK